MMLTDQAFTQFKTVLRSVKPFAKISDAELEQLAQRVKPIAIKPEQVIFAEGDIGHCLFVILEGTVQVVTTSAEGQPIILSHLQAGDFFGAQSLLPGSSGTRSATLIATEKGTLLEVSAEDFAAIVNQDSLLLDELQQVGDGLRQHKHLYAHNPALQAQAALYHIPGEGVVTLHADKLMGLDSLTTLYRYPNGVTITATKVLGKPVFSMSRTLANEQSTLEPQAEYYEEGSLYRELLIVNHRLIGVTVIGEWPDLGRVHRHIRLACYLFPWQLALFRIHGELWLNREREDFSAQAIVCQCMGVRRNTLNEALLQGCDSIDKLAEQTGASKVCGACIPALERLLGRLDNLQPVQLTAIIEVTADIKAFRFKPLHVPVQPSLPGQHIRVEAQIEGRWIQRSYTLTSPAGQQDYYEITVKREQYGLFSTWLHTEANAASLLRVSAPSGHFYPHSDKTVVYFAGGIGITPAIAMHRSLTATTPPFFVDYSVVTPEQIAYQQELSQNPQQVNFRITHGKQFIQPQEVCALTQQYPNAEFFVCGPNAYQTTVCNYLKQCAVSPAHINVEYFSSFTDAKAAYAKQQHARSVLLLSLGILVLLVLLFAIPFPYWPILHDSTWKQVTGFSLLGLNAFAMILGLRKSNLLALGYFKSWRLAHVLNGLILVVLVALHTGTQTGAHFNQIFLLIYLSLLLTGAGAGLSFFLQQRYSRRWLKSIHQGLKWAHFGLLWPFPALLLMHILTVYYF